MTSANPKREYCNRLGGEMQGRSRDCPTLNVTEATIVYSQADYGAEEIRIFCWKRAGARAIVGSASEGEQALAGSLTCE